MTLKVGSVIKTKSNLEWRLESDFIAYFKKKNGFPGWDVNCLDTVNIANNV